MNSTFEEFELDVGGHRISHRPSAGDLQRAANSAPLSAADLAAIEQKRAERYAALKTELAQARFAELEWQRLNEIVENDIPARKESLASDHCAAAAPIQSRLKEIESAIIGAIKDRKPGNAGLETERGELLEQLQSLNADLKASIGREDAILAQVTAERTAAAKAAKVCELEQEVLRLAPIPLRNELAVIRSSLKWASARVAAAQVTKPSESREAERTFAQSEVTRLQAAEKKAFRACLEA